VRAFTEQHELGIAYQIEEWTVVAFGAIEGMRDGAKIDCWHALRSRNE